MKLFAESTSFLSVVQNKNDGAPWLNKDFDKVSDLVYLSIENGF